MNRRPNLIVCWIDVKHATFVSRLREDSEQKKNDKHATTKDEKNAFKVKLGMGWYKILTVW